MVEEVATGTREQKQQMKGNGMGNAIAYENAIKQLESMWEAGTSMERNQIERVLATVYKMTANEVCESLKEAHRTEEKPSRSLDDRASAMEAAKSFIQRKGHHVLKTGYTTPFDTDSARADLITKDSDGLHFIRVDVKRDDGEGFPEEHIDEETREQFERISMDFLSSSDYDNAAIHFDIIQLLVFDNNRGCIRHHLNAFC